MKKAAGILLLFCLIVPFSGTRIWLESGRTRLRKEIREALSEGTDPEKLVCLAFVKGQQYILPRWEGHDEFELEGRMYDVVDAWESCDSVMYLCLPDAREDRLNKKIRSLVTGNRNEDPGNKEQRDSYRDFLKSLYCSDPSLWHAALCSGHHRNSFYTFPRYTSPAHRPPVPPPKPV